MTSKRKFKGGAIFLNSGGRGPDDYLIKPVVGGRWTLVIFRWGRNWQGKELGIEDARAAADSDRAAMEAIFPLQRVCIPDNAARLTTMRKRGHVPTMNATEFLDKYKHLLQDQ